MIEKKFDKLTDKMRWLREVVKHNRDKFKCEIYDAPVGCDTCGKPSRTVFEFKYMDMQLALHWITICQNCMTFLASDIT
jgi:hypothetical protein